MGTYEINEGKHCKSDDKGPDHQKAGRAAWLEAKGELRFAQGVCLDCNEGSEEDGHFHHSRTLPHQDTHEASHESRSSQHLWQRGQSFGEACQEGCESISGCRSEEADLHVLTG